VGKPRNRESSKLKTTPSCKNQGERSLGGRGRYIICRPNKMLKFLERACRFQATCRPMSFSIDRGYAYQHVVLLQVDSASYICVLFTLCFRRRRIYFVVTNTLQADLLIRGGSLIFYMYVFQGVSRIRWPNPSYHQSFAMNTSSRYISKKTSYNFLSFCLPLVMIFLATARLS